jgi:hypothetical protein
MDIVDKLRSLPPREVCEHGSIKAKCLVCEVADQDRRIAELEAALRRISERMNLSSDPSVDEIKRLAKAALGETD